MAPAFTLVGKDLADVSLAAYAGKRKALNIFPSIDTATCAMSVRHFNKDASGLKNTVVLCILPTCLPTRQPGPPMASPGSCCRAPGSYNRGPAFSLFRSSA